MGESCEIKITPEMLEAGVEMFNGADLRFESAEDVVTDIFNAMLRQRRIAAHVGAKGNSEPFKSDPLP